MKKEVRIFVLAAVLLCCVCLPVRADLITIGLTGKIIRADDPLNVFGGQIHLNDTITATYTYNTATLDSNPSNTSVGDYYHYSAPYGISVYIGNLVFETNENDVRFLVETVNNENGDSYLVLSENNICSNGALVEGITWCLTDSTQSVLSSDALPTMAPDLDDWDMDYGLSIIGPRGWDYRLRADIISVVLIPEPTTLLLLVFGIAILKRR